jgi:hypothetical protein
MRVVIDTAEIHCLSNISASTKPYAKRLQPVSQIGMIDEKTKGRKSRATVSLKTLPPYNDLD